MRKYRHAELVITEYWCLVCLARPVSWSLIFVSCVINYVELEHFLFCSVWVLSGQGEWMSRLPPAVCGCWVVGAGLHLGQRKCSRAMMWRSQYMSVVWRFGWSVSVWTYSDIWFQWFCLSGCILPEGLKYSLFFSKRPVASEGAWWSIAINHTAAASLRALLRFSLKHKASVCLFSHCLHWLGQDWCFSFSYLLLHSLMGCVLPGFSARSELTFVWRW